VAWLKGAAVGLTIERAGRAATLRLPIVGIVDDWSDQSGAIFVDRSAFRAAWEDDTANVFRVYVRRGFPVSAVRDAIIARYAGSRRLFVLRNAEVRSYIGGLTDQWMGLTYSQIGVAVLVAILGIVNTLTVSIIDRRRELGVLQAVGATRGQVRHTIWLEAVAIAVIGLVLGLALGGLTLHYILEMTHRDISGMSIPYVYPLSVALALVPTMVGAAFLAALGPAESAVRASLVQSLEYE
jgi:putative ABC transport system permease protein